MSQTPMKHDAADFLRRHPEVMETYVDAFMRAYYGDNTKATEAGIAAILPLIIRAGREEAAKHVRQRADMFAGQNSRDSALLFAECRSLAREIDAMTTLESLP